MNAYPGPGSALLVEYFIKTTLILVPALLAAAASKRRPAAFRHFILSFALIGLLLVPLLSLLPVGWRAPLLPSRPGGPAEFAPPSQAGLFSSDPVPVSGEAFQGAAGIEESGGLSSFPTWETAGPSEPAFSLPATSTESSDPVSGRPFPDGLVVFLWTGGLVVLLLRLAAGLGGAIRLTREGTGLGDPGWRILLARFLAIVPLRRRVRLRSHPEVVVPLTWGWRKPVILLPAGAGAWAEAERSSALFHELSHIKRADFLVLFFLRVSLAVFWWNPVCWLVYFRIRKEQEIACDELVLRAGIKPSTYAAGLLAIRRAAGLGWKASASLPGMTGRAPFKDRLAAILTQNMMIKEVKMKSRIMLAASIILAVAFIGTARPAVAENAALSPDGVLSESASPSRVAAPAQETKTEKEAVQEKEKEKEKTGEKSVTVKKVVIADDKDGGMPVEVTITEDGKTKKLLLSKPLTVKTDKDGRIIVFSAEGTDIPAPKDGTISIRIAGHDLKFIGEDKLLTLKEGETLAISEDDGKVLWVEKSEAGKHGHKMIIRKAGEGGPHPGWTIAKATGDPLWLVSEKERELLDKVVAIREQAEAVKAKKLDFAELEKSLKKLEEELKAKEEKIRTLTKTLEKGRGVWTIDEGTEAGEDAKIDILTRVREDVAGHMTVIWQRKDGTVAVVLTGKKGPEGRAAYDRALDQLKKELASGGKLLESKFDEELGVMTFKIEVPSGAAEDEKFIEKVVESIAGEAKK